SAEVSITTNSTYLAKARAINHFSCFSTTPVVSVVWRHLLTECESFRFHSIIVGSSQLQFFVFFPVVDDITVKLLCLELLVAPQLQRPGFPALILHLDEHSHPVFQREDIREPVEVAADDLDGDVAAFFEVANNSGLEPGFHVFSILSKYCRVKFFFFVTTLYT